MLNGRSRVTSENLRSAGGRSRFCSAWPCARFQRSSELSRQHRRFFYPCKIESLFKDLHLHDLAAEQAFEVPNSLLQPTNLGCGNHILIGPDRLLTPFAHQPSPSEDQARGEPMTTGNIADRHARSQRLVDDRELLLRRKPTPAGNAGDDFHLRKRLGHRRMPRTMPSSSG